MKRVHWISLFAAVTLTVILGMGCALSEVDVSTQRQTVLDKLIQLVMDSKEYHYSYDEKNTTYKLTFNIDCTLGTADVYVKAFSDGIGINCYSPIYAAQDNRLLMAEFITRANYGLKAGHFEMDFSDGEIRYRTYICAKEGLPTVEDISFMTNVTLNMMEYYGNGISKVALTGYDPVAAVTECEAL